MSLKLPANPFPIKGPQEARLLDLFLFISWELMGVFPPGRKPTYSFRVLHHLDSLASGDVSQRWCLWYFFGDSCCFPDHLAQFLLTVTSFLVPPAPNRARVTGFFVCSARKEGHVSACGAIVISSSFKGPGRSLLWVLFPIHFLIAIFSRPLLEDLEEACFRASFLFTS